MARPLKHPALHLLPIRPKVVSSRVSSGTKLFAEGGDGRSAWGRRWRDLCLSHANDLGGAEILTEAQVSIIKRASAMECECEALEARMSAGEAVDPDQYGRLAGRLCRLFELIGIKRLTKPLDPLSEFAKAFEGYPPKPPDEDDEDDEDEDEEDEDEPAPIEEEPGEA